MNSYKITCQRKKPFNYTSDNLRTFKIIQNWIVQIQQYNFTNLRLSVVMDHYLIFMKLIWIIIKIPLNLISWKIFDKFYVNLPIKDQFKLFFAQKQYFYFYSFLAHIHNAFCCEQGLRQHNALQTLNIRGGKKSIKSC